MTTLPKDNNPTPLGGLDAALDLFKETYVIAAGAMARHGLPVSVGTYVFADTTEYLASLRVLDRHQHQALEEMLPTFVRLTYQPTSALNKHNPDAVWDALRLLLKNVPVRAAELARLRSDRGGGGGGAGGGGGGGGYLTPTKPDAKLPVKPDAAKSPAMAKTSTFQRPLPPRRPGSQDQYPHITCFSCGAKGHYAP